MRFQTVLFDVDGTLIHSSPGILQTLRETFERMGVDCSGFDLQQYLGPPLRRTFAQHFQDSEDVEKAVTLYRALYKESGQYACRLFPGVEEMLRRLNEEGVLLCTATSKPAEVARPILEHLGIDRWFTIIGGAAMDSSLDTKTAVMRHVLCQPPVAGRPALMVGDSLTSDMVCAERLHVDFILFGKARPAGYAGMVAEDHRAALALIAAL